jgi:ornithine cyclodeaminase/alanine dehydrogenase-like protein (mu-crystallin family)
VIVGRYTGRAHPQDVTLFKSLGIAIEDVAVAARHKPKDGQETTSPARLLFFPTNHLTARRRRDTKVPVLIFANSHAKP